MILEVITPDYLLYKGEVNSISLHGKNGYFGVLDNHAPMITTLKEGKVSIKKDSKAKIEGELSEKANKKKYFEFELKGGVVEILDNKVIVLAD